MADFPFRVPVKPVAFVGAALAGFAALAWIVTDDKRIAVLLTSAAIFFLALAAIGADRDRVPSSPRELRARSCGTCDELVPAGAGETVRGERYCDDECARHAW